MPAIDDIAVERQYFRICLPSNEGHAEVRTQQDGRFEVWVENPASYGGGYRSAWNLGSFEGAVRNIMDVLWTGCLPFEGEVHEMPLPSSDADKQEDGR